MFETVSPEQVGVSSTDIKAYVSYLEKNRLSTHSIVMARHGKVFYEQYWAPFHKDFLHRLYSDSKSYVSLAIGFLVQDGLVDLDKPIVSYFDEDITKGADEHVKKQTVKDMLKMCTGFPMDQENWFSLHGEDRLRIYFETSGQGKQKKVPGTLYRYDSCGSFVLCALVETVSKKTFDEFMREKLYSKIGVSEDTYTLTCPGGHSWGDSGILCRAIDQAKVIQFVMQEGAWEGEQILDKTYIKTACSKLVDNNPLFLQTPYTYGYGYQIWRTRDNSFFFNGMGCQFAVAVPEKDLIFVINSDNQGIDYAKRVILDGFFDMVANRITEETLPEHEAAYKELVSYSSDLKLLSLDASEDRGLAEKIHGKEYIMQENPMGITKIRFTFEGDIGTLYYTNAQGDKTLSFGIGKNAFGLFPEEGYSDLLGNTFTPGHYYECAASAAFSGDNQLNILVQIIDKYFGRLCMRFGFSDDEISVIMEKTAEDFLDEYQGWAIGKKEA